MPSKGKARKRKKLPVGPELEREIREKLEEHTPWNEISSDLRVSTRRISKVQKGMEQGGEVRDWKAEGRIDSQIFTMFRNGEDPATVIATKKLPSEYVQRKWEAFRQMRSEYDMIYMKGWNEGYQKGDSDGRKDFKSRYGWIEVKCGDCGDTITLWLNNQRDREILDFVLSHRAADAFTHGFGCRDKSEHLRKA